MGVEEVKPVRQLRDTPMTICRTGDKWTVALPDKQRELLPDMYGVTIDTLETKLFPDRAQAKVADYLVTPVLLVPLVGEEARHKTLRFSPFVTKVDISEEDQKLGMHPEYPTFAYSVDEMVFRKTGWSARAVIPSIDIPLREMKQLDLITSTPRTLNRCNPPIDLVEYVTDLTIRAFFVMVTPL